MVCLPADVRICRIEDVGHSDIYASFVILIRGSVDLAASRNIVAAHPKGAQILPADYALTQRGSPLNAWTVVGVQIHQSCAPSVPVIG